VRKILLLTVLVSVAVSVQAQNAGSSSGPTTIQGCLRYHHHEYTLRDNNGKNHQLSGYANKLKPHTGHEVEVTGTESTHTVNTTQEGAASTVKEVTVFKVTSVKKIADTCPTGD